VSKTVINTIIFGILQLAIVGS